MKPIHTRLIVLLTVVSSVLLGFVLYANYALDRNNHRLIVHILKDAQAQAVELERRVVALQEQLVNQQQVTISGSLQAQSAAIPVELIALNQNSDDTIDLRSGTSAYDYTSPDDYWDAVQRYAKGSEYLRLNPQKQQQFLENGADLIRKLEEVETHFRIDSESLQFLEAQLGDGGIAAIESLYRVKKQLAGYVSEGKQYRRELEAMLREPSTPTLPKVTHQLPRQEGRESEYYHPALVDSWVICDSTGNFLISIRFVYRTQVGGFPKIANVEDTINLRTMQSINGSYHYPDYFMQEIYSLVRKSFRQGVLKFHGMTDKAAQLQQFLSLIS